MMRWMRASRMKLFRDETVFSGMIVQKTHSWKKKGDNAIFLKVLE